MVGTYNLNLSRATLSFSYQIKNYMTIPLKYMPVPGLPPTRYHYFHFSHQDASDAMKRPRSVLRLDTLECHYAGVSFFC